MNSGKFNIGKNLDNTNRVELTSQGKKDLENKLRRLIDEERPKVQEELSEARAQGDLSENAEYDAAKNKQSEIEAEIARIEDVLTRVKIIRTAKTTDLVSLGSTITYKKGTKEKTVMIVPDAEYDPLGEVVKTGVNTPFAKSILGAKVGDKVSIHTDRPYKIEIVKIK